MSIVNYLIIDKKDYKSSSSVRVSECRVEGHAGGEDI
jgi:hypothetical protein